MKTPDPALSTEAIAALLVALATNALILFQLDLTDAQTAALTGLVNGLVIVGYFVHGLLVRRKRVDVVVAETYASVDKANGVRYSTATVTWKDVPDAGDAHSEPGKNDVALAPRQPVDVAGEVAAS